MFSRLKSILDPGRLLLVVPGIVFLSLLAAVAKPFGADGSSFVVRFLFWMLVMLVAAAIAKLSGNIVKKMGMTDRQFVHDLSMTGIVALLFTPSLWVLISMLTMSTGGKAPEALTMMQYGAIFATGLLVLRRSFPAPVQNVPQPEPVKPRIFKRLPETFDARILRLAVRDHSVDIVSTDGIHTIRSRFADAIDEMEPIVGHYTHRSHWVCRDAIESVERRAGKIQIRLINGDLVPVSRKYKPSLEEVGIL